MAEDRVYIGRMLSNLEGDLSETVAEMRTQTTLMSELVVNSGKGSTVYVEPLGYEQIGFRQAMYITCNQSVVVNDNEGVPNAHYTANILSNFDMQVSEYDTYTNNEIISSVTGLMAMNSSGGELFSIDRAPGSLYIGIVSIVDFEKIVKNLRSEDISKYCTAISNEFRVGEDFELGMNCIRPFVTNQKYYIVCFAGDTTEGSYKLDMGLTLVFEYKIADLSERAIV